MLPTLTFTIHWRTWQIRGVKPMESWQIRVRILSVILTVATKNWVTTKCFIRTVCIFAYFQCSMVSVYTLCNSCIASNVPGEISWGLMFNVYTAMQCFQCPPHRCPHHGVRLPRSCLSVSKQAHIVALRGSGQHRHTQILEHLRNINTNTPSITNTQRKTN